MNKVLVRAWKKEVHRKGAAEPDSLLLTYPEGNNGHKLITCLNCGKVYAVTVLKEVYVGPCVEEKVKEQSCVKCGAPLEDNFAYYPDTYVASGEVHHYERPLEIPNDCESVVVEMDGIYE